jgi:hypothetical protein
MKFWYTSSTQPRQSENMLTIQRDAKHRTVERFISGEPPRITEDTDVSSTSPHTRALPGRSWTGALVGQLEESQVVVATVSAADALTSASVGGSLFIAADRPTVDTSNMTEVALKHHLVPSNSLRVCIANMVENASELTNYVSVSRALRGRITEIAEYFVATLRSDEPISIGELRESLQQRGRIDQELAARQRALLARAGGALTTTQVAQRLNVSEQEVDELRTAGRLLAVPDPDSQGWAYPACQLEGPRIVTGLSEVLSDFAVKSPWTRLYMLISEDPALDGRTPIEALKDVDLELVREIVRGYGQQGGD